MALFLVVEQDTYFKLRPQQSPELEDNEKEFIQAGRTFELHSYAYADATLGSFNGHIKFALKKCVDSRFEYLVCLQCPHPG